MSYIKQEWKDRFIDPVTGEVTNGTAITATRMNNIESGIFNAHLVLDQHVLDIANLKNRVGLIESTFPDNFQHNLFRDNFTDLVDINLVSGYYNETQSRLEV